jgi:hypothetical protein
MRFLTSLLFLAALPIPALSETLVWSSCQTVIGVVNEPVGSAANVIVTLSPGISGCAYAGVPGAVGFQVGEDGVVAENLNGFLASALAAMAMSRQIQVAYDTSSSTNCWATAITVGGTNGQCP